MIPETHTFAPEILRKYDIRGITNVNLHGIDGYFVGRALATLVGPYPGIICAGYDGRNTSPGMMNAVQQGIRDSGYEALSLDLVPTPVVYFASHYQRDIAGSIMITGSHNPSVYNGFKMMKGLKCLTEQEILQLAEIAKAGTFHKPQRASYSSDGTGIVKAYINHVLSHTTLGRNKNFTIAWDPGNGAVGAILNDVIKGLPGKHYVINGEVDGYFPAHHPDPSDPRNLKQLQSFVLLNKCDLGIAFDGDGDRIAVITKHGQMVQGDNLLLIYALDLINRRHKPKIVVDVKTSDAIVEAIRLHGGQPIVWKTGHSFMKEKIAEERAALGGEVSGHMFFGEDHYGFDDAIFAALKLLSILSNGDFYKYLGLIPKRYTMSDIKLYCDESEKFQILDKIRDICITQKLSFLDIDGIRVQNDFGWWLIRASNTENYLIIKAEAVDHPSLTLIKREIEGILSKLLSKPLAANSNFDNALSLLWGT